MEYTHNLKIILLDSSNNIIEDKPILDGIKKILSEDNTHSIGWNTKFLDVTIKWNKIVLTDVNQALMGDLFACPIYDYDSIILNHTHLTIANIKCKYTIKFHISRLLRDKTINKNSGGVV